MHTLLLNVIWPQRVIEKLLNVSMYLVVFYKMLIYDSKTIYSTRFWTYDVWQKNIMKFNLWTEPGYWVLKVNKQQRYHNVVKPFYHSYIQFFIKIYFLLD